MVMNRTNWDDKPEVKAGNYGEELVDKYLEERGFICYFPKTQGPHWFDRLAIKNKEQVVVAESKTKPRREYYPDTGINYKQYIEYKRIYKKHKIPVFIFFVDRKEKKIYGNFLSELEKERMHEGYDYPRIEEGRDKIIYFPLDDGMRQIAELSDEDVAYLDKHYCGSY